jgi:hypothetical protein
MAALDIETLRKPKILGMAVFDWVVSLTAATIVGIFVLHLRTVGRWVLWFIVWTMFGVAVHKMFGVNTMLGYYLGLNEIVHR